MSEQEIGDENSAHHNGSKSSHLPSTTDGNRPVTYTSEHSVFGKTAGKKASLQEGPILSHHHITTQKGQGVENTGRAGDSSYSCHAKNTSVTQAGNQTEERKVLPSASALVEQKQHPGPSSELQQQSADESGQPSTSEAHATESKQDRADDEGRKVKERKERELRAWILQHKAIAIAIVMSQITLSVVSCFFGMWGMFQYLEHTYSSNLMERIMERVATNHSVIEEAMLEKSKQQVLPSLHKEVQNITIVTHEYQCLLSAENQWKMFESDLNMTEKKLQVEYQKKLEKEMEAFKLSYEEKLNTTQNKLEREMNYTRSDMKDQLRQSQEMVEKTEGKMANLSVSLNGRMDEILNTSKPWVLENQGFLKIDSIGPFLVIMGIVEALLSLCICVLCGRSLGAARGSPPPLEQRGANAVAGAISNGGETAQLRQQRPPYPRINKNNSNVVCVCFRAADEDLSNNLGRQLVESCRRGNIRLRTFVVNAMDDIQAFPPCRVAMVFVDPDEREMLIEDERYHIGQGLRRHTVQCLLDSGVEVFIIIYNDKNSATLPSHQMYNSKLGQVDEHALLKMLKRKERVFSVKDNLFQHQTSHIVEVLNTMFD